MKDPVKSQDNKEIPKEKSGFIAALANKVNASPNKNNSSFMGLTQLNNKPSTETNKSGLIAKLAQGMAKK